MYKSILFSVKKAFVGVASVLAHPNGMLKALVIALLALIVPTKLLAAEKEAYVLCTPTSSTLIFFYDDLRSTHLVNFGIGSQAFTLDTWGQDPDYSEKQARQSANTVIFDSSFAEAWPTSTYQWFYGMSNLTTINGISNLNASEVTNMSYMFSGCIDRLTSLDLSKFNTSKVTDMSYMFYDCAKLTELDLSSFNTSSVTNMTSMFDACKALTELDLSSFNTSKVTDMSYMFYMCYNLRTIYVNPGNRDWNSPTVTSSDYMFDSCNSIEGGAGTGYNARHIDKEYARVDGGSSNPGYFTLKVTFLRGDVNGDGNITIADVTALVNIILGKETAGQYNHAAADVNLDSNITIADVSALVNIILREDR